MKYWSLVLITFCLFSPLDLQANSPLQLKINDKVRIYSDKAFRKSGGSYFEAVGNVIIISDTDTLYGEKASFDLKKGKVELEGSVRYIGKGITIYGAKIDFDIKTSKLEMKHARVVTSEFSIVANLIRKDSETLYYAEEAEFTTCKDCKESWLISGKRIYIELNQYVQIHHAFAKVKGIDVLYLPYIALPIKNKRESGVLFPRLYTHTDDGLYYEQPYFWAINSDKDATITPTFYGDRGYGVDLQYRQAFRDDSWFEFNTRSLSDRKFEISGDSRSTSYLRYFTEVENKFAWSENTQHYFRFTGSRDLDFSKDFTDYAEDYVRTPSYGGDFFLSQRFTQMSLSLEASHRRSFLGSDREGENKKYVQTLPKINFSSSPYIFLQKNRDYLYKGSLGFESNISVFKQDEFDEAIYLRNATRAEFSPYIRLDLFSKGPFSLNTRYVLDYQEYRFADDEEKNFYKSRGTIATEFNFSVEKVFGEAYKKLVKAEEQSSGAHLENGEIKKRRRQTVGELPIFEESLTEKVVEVSRNSYRHSQNFRFIHYQKLSTSENGNSRFLSQIETEEGWFDFKDALNSSSSSLASNELRKEVPTNNTFEFQWNNVLIKKTPKSTSRIKGNDYLNDNFLYSKMGYFNLSQGYLLSGEGDSFNDKLTRLFVDSSYYTGRWKVYLKDYFFHQEGNHILEVSGERQFDSFNLLSSYNLNSFEDSNLKTLKLGFQVRPIDIFGFSILKEQDLDARENISSIYQVDFMPNNNCWIINVNYKDTPFEKRYAFNFEFNFGSEEFSNYKKDFFSFNRLK